ncbi:MAG: hypothetical protein NC187_01575 [Candidatus Amulumruptor caecigallinarius]|nr:hypothetical protein [Candidatus Amulumruptor caecigallinarius]MCM1396165.1 hypothetical protein [Candidatus Amulumruptor caecigallinarius]MCM1453835.1 hypothetical protein [bacterium]
MDTQTQSDKADCLFDLTLEIEGLLALIRRREDFTAPEVYALLLDKVAALAEGVGELCPDTTTPARKETSSAALTREQKFLETVPSLPGLWDDGEDAAEAEMEQEVSEAERDEPAACRSEEAGKEIAQAVLYETEEDADETPSMVAEEEAPAPETEQIAPADEKPAAQPEQHPKEERRTKHAPGDLRRAFTVNDKFRFRRELFGNSDTEFTDTLNLVEAMTSYEEAEDYFITDLGWDREMPEVAEFLVVIEKYFA